MAATIKSITKELNYLENLKGQFPDIKDLNLKVTELQVEFAAALVLLLSKNVKRLVSGVFTAEEEEALRNQDKVKAIKLVRGRTGMGLGEAKQFVENEAVKHGYARWEEGTTWCTGYKNFVWNKV